MIGMGTSQPVQRWHTPDPEAGPSTAPADPQATARSSPARDASAIENALRMVENDLSDLYRRARQENRGQPNAGAPATHQIRTSALIHNDRTRSGEYMIVAYHDRTDAGRIRHYRCHLKAEFVNEIQALSQRHLALKAELAAAHKEKGKNRDEAQSHVARHRPSWITSKMPFPFMALPNELKLMTMSCLDTTALHQLRQTNRHVETFAVDFLPAWKFKSASDFIKIATALEKRGLIHKIRSVTLEGPAFRAEDLAHLRRFTGLEKLTLRSCEQLDDECGTPVGHCKRLKELDVAYCDFGDGFLARMLPRPDQDNTMLEVLTLDGNRRITDRSANSIARFRAIKNLSVADCDLRTPFLQGLVPELDDGIVRNRVL